MNCFVVNIVHFFVLFLGQDNPTSAGTTVRKNTENGQLEYCRTLERIFNKANPFYTDLRCTMKYFIEAAIKNKVMNCVFPREQVYDQLTFKGYYDWLNHLRDNTHDNSLVVNILKMIPPKIIFGNIFMGNPYDPEIFNLTWYLRDALKYDFMRTSELTFLQTIARMDMTHFQV